MPRRGRPVRYSAQFIRTVRLALASGATPSQAAELFGISPKYARDLQADGLRRVDSVEIPAEVAALPPDDVEVYRIFAVIGTALERAKAGRDP